ncbi:MAG: hypothetical protein JSS98_06120 [Bacteroidetes bacterium]|nr:hypothetical protein [Bacteroidota bacterium]
METYTYEDLEGEGVKDTILNIKDRLKHFYHGVRLKFPPKERFLLEKYGNFTITKIIVCRAPIKSYIEKALNILSFGKFQNIKQTLPYDKMFHLYMLVTLSNSQILRIEKNEVVKISDTFKIDSDTEYSDVNLNKDRPTLNDFFHNTIKQYGEQSFFVYNAFSNNCQKFILDNLTANNIIDEQLTKFIYQDLTKLVEELPEFTKNISKDITDTAHRFDILLNGYGLKKK